MVKAIFRFTFGSSNIILALTKTDIIKKSIPIFKNKGYAATSTADIAAACGILKGSLYHHFVSKDDLMLDALWYLKYYFKDKVFAIAYNKTITIEKRLERLARKSEEQFLEGPGGCLMAMIGSETVMNNLKFNEIIVGFFEDWKRAFVHLYAQICDQKCALSHADKAIMLIEGAVVMMRIHKNPEYLTRVQENLIAEFKAMNQTIV